MTIPSDLTVDARQQQIVLSSNGRSVTIENSGRYGPFARGPVAWSFFVMAYLEPALSHLQSSDQVSHTEAST